MRDKLGISEEELVTRVNDIDLERLLSMIIAVPFDDPGKDYTILFGRKVSRIQLIINTLNI